MRNEEIAAVAANFSDMKVSAKLVDGGLLEYHIDAGVVERLRKLERAGYEGKQLINKLLTDDWGAPPVTVTISGADPGGKFVRVVLEYD